MPRKLTRRLRSHPVTFSRFARTLALASLHKVNRNIRNSKNSRHAPPMSSGNYSAVVHSLSVLLCDIRLLFFLSHPF